MRYLFVTPPGAKFPDGLTLKIVDCSESTNYVEGFKDILTSEDTLIATCDSRFVEFLRQSEDVFPFKLMHLAGLENAEYSMALDIALRPIPSMTGDSITEWLRENGFYKEEVEESLDDILSNTRVDHSQVEVLSEAEDEQMENEDDGNYPR
jgi:hypothetical protein